MKAFSFTKMKTVYELNLVCSYLFNYDWRLYTLDDTKGSEVGNLLFHLLFTHITEVYFGPIREKYFYDAHCIWM